MLYIVAHLWRSHGTCSNSVSIKTEIFHIFPRVSIIFLFQLDSVLFPQVYEPVYVHFNTMLCASCQCFHISSGDVAVPIFCPVAHDKHGSCEL